MSRLSFVLIPSMLFFQACGSTQECSDKEELIDGVCVRTDDTDLPIIDTSDTEPPDPNVREDLSKMTIEWTIEALPNDIVVEVVCNDRVVFNEDNFTYFTTHTREFEVLAEEECTVELTDRRGGLLPSGRLINCSEEVASWESVRGLRNEPATITTFACIGGCVDPIAENYDAEANLDDGTCEYILGCTNPQATNYDPEATKNDGSCNFGGFGPLEAVMFTDNRPADNRIVVECGPTGTRALQLFGNGRPTWGTASVKGIVDAGFECTVIVSDSVGDSGPGGLVKSCGEPLVTWGPIQPADNPYEIVVGTFTTLACSGCTDPVATNFDTEAQVDDGSCLY